MFWCSQVLGGLVEVSNRLVGWARFPIVVAKRIESKMDPLNGDLFGRLSSKLNEEDVDFVSM